MSVRAPNILFPTTEREERRRMANYKLVTFDACTGLAHFRATLTPVITRLLNLTTALDASDPSHEGCLGPQPEMS